MLDTGEVVAGWGCLWDSEAEGCEAFWKEKREVLVECDFEVSMRFS